MPNKLSAILLGRPLAGGRSSKMHLAFGEETVLGRTLKAYGDFDEVLVVSAGDADSVAQAIRSSGVANARAVNMDPAEYSVASQMKAGVAAASSNARGIAVGMSDMPTLTSELVGELSTRFTSGKAKILAPVCQKAIGMPTFFDASLKQELGGLQEPKTLWDVLKAHGNDVDAFEIFHTGVLRGIEDTDDYHALLRMAGLPVPVEEEQGVGSSANGSAPKE